MRCARKQSTRAAGFLLALVAVAALPAAPALAGPAQATSTVARAPGAVEAGAGLPRAPIRRGQLAELCQQQPRPSNSIAETPWAQARLQFDRVHTFATGREVTVAVVDTGVWASHPQLNGPELDGGVVDQDNGGSLVGDGVSATVDCDGHGTLIAGIIAARPADDTNFQGIAPFAKILPVRVTNSLDEGSAGTLADGINYAVDQGVDIINVSVLADNEFPALVDAIKRALDNNIVVVTAAGNTGAEDNAKRWPAELARKPGFEGLIVVGATNQDGTLAPFTTTSVPASVAAPGVGVTGPAPIQGHTRNDNDGTSFAAPFVSGTAALVLEAYDKQLTPLQVKRRLQLTADHPGADLPAEGLGYGVVNPYEAVTAILPESSSAPATPEAGIKPLAADTGPDTTARDVALIVSGTAVGLALITLGAVATYRRGRDRSWQPSQERPQTQT
ncbi:S8 family serine peptidase [Actinopolymorpha sp. B17G11]|uniref:S8 family serine peptidase n=1 Tax=Actinopolymorpha sp. B17G11 TaxID=3160861 RepID=UPI0032E36B9E